MVFSEYAKGWMLVLQREGHRPRRIVSILTDEGVPASVAGVLQRDKQRGERTVVERRKCGGGDANERWPERRCVRTEYGRAWLYGSVAIVKAQRNGQTDVE